MQKNWLKTMTLLLAGLLTLGGCGDGGTAAVLMTPVYPEMAPYPNEQAYVNASDGMFDSEGFSDVYDAWRKARAERRNQPEGYTDGTVDFTRQAARAFLTGTEDNNALLSPLNVYLALGMLTEVTDGQSREQILQVLGADSMETLRSRADSLWNANYCDDGALTSVLASSMWLDRHMQYHTESLEKLASVYRASAYQGDMGDPAYDSMLQDWLNEQTGGLLEESVKNLHMDPETILALASTVYYRGKWGSEFQAENNEERIFHSPAGDMECTFMRQTDMHGVYYWSEQFGAISRRMEEGGRMWFILPDEGVEMDAILQSDALYDLLDPSCDWTDQKTLKIHQYIPQFDVSSDQDLRKGLAAMGITDVFDAAEADFSPLTDRKGVSLSQVKHAVRVAIDEEGVTAASYVAMMMAGASRPPAEEMDFILDRPFLFALTGTDDVILFMGVVNRP
ncbi:MAG: serpin family protein [Ruminococcaceae bacterium]|nr:serpin family protein [Oscillospiraceae bacterium]